MKFMQHEVNYQVIIKTRSICMFRYMGAIYFRIQVKRRWLLKIDGERRTMFRMGPVHARDNGLGVSGTEPERTARHRDLLYARRSQYTPEQEQSVTVPTEYTQGIIAHPADRQGGRGATTLLGNAWWPPDRIQQEQLHNICVATINIEAISIPINFPCPGVSCLNITVLNINVHRVFTKVQYPWLSYYRGQQEYNIRSNVRSLPISGVQVYKSSGVQEFRSTGVQEYQVYLSLIHI